MDISAYAIMPLDPSVYLAVLFGAGPVIMGALYLMQFIKLKNAPTIFVITYSGLAGWYYCEVERIALPMLF